MVPGAGRRHIAQFIAQGTNMPGKINVFTVHKYGFIKAACFLQHIAAHYHTGSTAPSGFQCHRIVIFRMLKGKLPQLEPGKGIIRLLNHFFQLHKGIRENFRINIVKENKRTGACSGSGITCGAKAAVLLLRQNGKAAKGIPVGFLQLPLLQSAVRRGIIRKI